MMSEEAINALAARVAESYLSNRASTLSATDFISLFLDTRDLAHEMIVQREKRIEEKSNDYDDCAKVQEKRTHFLQLV